MHKEYSCPACWGMEGKNKQEAALINNPKKAGSQETVPKAKDEELSSEALMSPLAGAGARSHSPGVKS